MIRYGSVCSGIEAASVAWEPLGWRATFLSEIDKFPCAVLRHHYPHAPNHGDMTLFKDWPDEPIDLLVGGTPCQSFSVAGLRAGLADPRGNLMLTYLAIAAKYRPRWLVWENVPGVLSSGKGRDFASLLGGLGELGYGFAYRVLDAQYIRVGGFGRAVPQRRRRVFVVGYLGDWRRAAAALFDAESLRGDSPPRREAGEAVAPTISARPTGGGGLGTDFDLDGGLVESTYVPAVSLTLTARDRKGPLPEADLSTVVVSHALRADGFDASEDGTGRGTPIIAVSDTLVSNGDAHSGFRDEKGLIVQPIPFDTTQITSAANRSVPKAGDPMHPIAAGAHPPAIALLFTPTIAAAAPVYPINTQIATRHEALGERTGMGIGSPDDPAFTLQAGHSHAIATEWAVRRLTPKECCRLQGFPDDFLSQVQFRGKPPADGPMYKALGNSMAVNCMRWIGERIAMVDAS